MTISEPGRPQGSPEHAVAITPDCPPQLDVKTLLLETPHPLVAEHQENNLKIPGRLSSCQLAFVVLKGVMQAPWREKISVFLSSTRLCMLQY